MNCERFESLLLDELYGELDELTSAAMRKHAQGCSHCAAKLEGLKRTRAALQLNSDVEVPSSLEARILDAVADAEKVTPIDIVKKRNSGWISRAGRWAMRPQTAMAALFVLMLGSSAVLMRSRQSNSKRSVSVEEMGSPEAKAGDGTSNQTSKAASGSLASSAPAKSMPRARGEEDESKESARVAKDESKDKFFEVAPIALPAASGAATTTAPSDPQNMPGIAQNGSGYGGLAADRAVQPAPPPPMAAAEGATDGHREKQNMQRGLEQYKKRDFDNARRNFQSESKNDPNAALWAARAAREGSGKCNTAVKEFDAIAKSSRGTPAGDQAALESAKCLRAMGAHAEADARLRTIENSPTAGPAAKAELEASRGRTTSRAAAPAAPQKSEPAKPAATNAH